MWRHHDESPADIYTSRLPLIDHLQSLWNFEDICDAGIFGALALYGRLGGIGGGVFRALGGRVMVFGLLGRSDGVDLNIERGRGSASCDEFRGSLFIIVYVRLGFFLVLTCYK